MECKHVKFLAAVSREIDEFAINVLRGEGSPTGSTIRPINSTSGQELKLVNSLPATSYKI